MVIRREVLSTTSADLLVIGPRGSGLLKRLHVGSVAEALLDNPSAPLLVAHDNHTVEHITIAVDGSGYSEQAVRIVAASPVGWGYPRHLVGCRRGRRESGRGRRERCRSLWSPTHWRSIAGSYRTMRTR